MQGVKRECSITKNPIEYKTQTIHAYDMVATTVVRGFDEYFERYAHAEAAHFLTYLRHGSRILDLGCGGGVASQYFINQGHHVVSGDLSEAMLLECRRRRVPSPLRLDLEALPFQPHVFDAIWTHTALIHIPKDHFTQTLESFVTVLKPQGRVFVALRGGQGEGYVERIEEPMWFSHFEEHEFVHFLPKAFEMVCHRKIQPGRGIFLNYHLISRL